MFRLSSPAFEDSGPIPRQYTADGADLSPPLVWAGAPRETRSFALIVDDPDAPDPRAPERTWVHWIVYNIPPTATALPEGAALHGLPVPACQGRNDWKKERYGGPAPPVGRHRYVMKLYALDTVQLPLAHPTKAQLLAAMKGHVLAEGQLIGTYEALH